MERRRWFYDCFRRGGPQLGGMSLNRNEQMVCDYVEKHPEERQFWQGKVRFFAAESGEGAAAVLALELWHYFVERSRVVEPFRSQVQREGLQRTSMRNLADYWLRLWGPPKPKRPPRNDGAQALGGPYA